jgi:YegS/Rv2252/BmrU family lipid kinase
MRALLLYNTSSGRGLIRGYLTDIVSIFTKAGIEITPRRIEFSQNPFEGMEDVELVVVCGGDGTVNFVVNAMKSRGLDPAIGVIPVGTANDFASAIGMDSSIVGAARQIAGGKIRRVDCGKVNDRYFVNILSFGIFTTASQRTPRNAKQQFGILAYIKPGIDDVKDMHSIKVNIKTDKEEYEGNIYMFLAFNGITAGRIPLTRDSHVDDGVMDVIVLEKRNKLLSFSNMLRYVLGGNPEAVRHFRCSEMVVTTNQHSITDVDGERGPNFPLHIICEPRSLKIRM